MRLGFSIRVYGCPDLPSYDARPWYREPHLSVSLAYLHDILRYLQANDIHMYRMHSRLLPRPADNEATDCRAQIEECASQLAALGKLAREADVRLSFHPYSIVLLSALNEEQASRSGVHLETQAALMDAMALGDEATIVVHVGGIYEGAAAAGERFIRRYEALPGEVRRRLALENDDRCFSHADVWAIHQKCGVRLVFDQLHHLVLNPGGIPMREALEHSLRTWPEDLTPKIHFSSPRTEMRPLKGSSRIKVPSWTEHSDFVDPFSFIAFMRMAEGLRAFDVMLEGKARDLAVLKLREDLQRFAPELAKRILWRPGVRRAQEGS